MLAEHSGGVPDGWMEGYETPVFVYCDRPACEWNGVAEWREVAPRLDEWMQGEAPTWEEVVVRGDGPSGAGEDYEFVE